MLAAVEGAPPVAREQATFTINLLQGGTAGQVVVVPQQPPSAKATRDLGDSLHRQADAFAAATHTQVAVGGPAGNLANFTSATSSRLWLVILALALATTALLTLALRAVLVAVAAVALNLVTVAATFGVLQAGFGGSNPVLGGPGYIDPMSTIGIFAAVFGISTAFEVFLLSRTREHILEGESPRAAIRDGLRHTAYAVTGSAIVMVAAAIPFVAGDMLAVSQFGLAIAVAVLLDAFIVRPIVLPAAVELMGPTAWWPTRVAGEDPPATTYAARPATPLTP